MSPSRADETEGYVTACRIGDIADGTAKRLLIGERCVALIRRGGRFFAIDDRCPHAGASLAMGYLDEGDVIRCRIHHWAFHLEGGHPADPGQPPGEVSCFPVRLVGDQVQIRLRPRANNHEASDSDSGH